MRSHNRAFEAIGTHWQIDTARQLSTAEWTEIDQRIEDFDRTYSRFRPDSLVAKMAAGAGVFEFPEDVIPLLSFYRRLYDITGGAVSPLVGGTLEDLGYDAGYRLAPVNLVRTTPAWDDVLTWQGATLSTTAPVVLDVGAAGKGYLIDIVAGLLDGFGVDSFVIDASGDLLHRGPDALRVGLEHPADPSKVIGVVPVANSALAASAANRRTWGSADRVLHHIVDPRTSEPTRQITASWVSADSAMVADGLATAMFFADATALEQLTTEFDAGWLRVSGSGSAHWSPAFEGALFR
ncbi:MAG: FAD:protein FMN transferase [Nakamurella sp.]